MKMNGEKNHKYDAVVIGTGVAGLYQLHLLRNLGLSVRAFEKGTDVGGTWYWNRYPGCRFDSESYTYQYSFSNELLEDWNWSEHFAPQPETLKYMQHVADRFDLRKDIQFSTTVKSTKYHSSNNHWEIETDKGETFSCQFLITALGILSEPYIPNIKGINDFKGQSWHTSNWPKEEVKTSNKRIGVIGTGATGVQLITELAKDVEELYVFQLKPEYCIPLHNDKIDEATQKDIKKNQDKIFEKCNNSYGSFLHDFKYDQSALDVSEEERNAFYEKLWNERGFALWLGNYSDLLTDEKANETISEFVRDKIRSQIDDPVTAEKLCPKDHGFGTRRVPCESGYYKAYNQKNVHLIDISETPITCINETGIKTKSGQYDLDIIVFATGFDGVTGAYNKVRITGENGTNLSDEWKDGPETFLGMQTPGFPNLFTVCGPHNGSTFCNIPRCLEQNAEWISDCVDYINKNGYSKIEAELEAAKEWTDYAYEVAAPSLFAKTASWFSGANIPGKKRTFLSWAGGSPKYREKCNDVASTGYKGFKLS